MTGYNIRPTLTGWADDAACIDLPTDLFFQPDGSRIADDVYYGVPRRVCVGCPVRESCLDAAMVEESGGSDYRYGMRGGMTPRERARLAVTTSQAAGVCVDCGARVSRIDTLRCRDCHVANRKHVATHCPQGHAYTEDNVRIRPIDGSRSCRTCDRERNRARRAKEKAGAA